MAVGENDGTWGPKTNTNMQMLESGVTGVVSLTLSSSDVTLTDSDFTDDQSKKRIIDCSGTLTGAVNIIVPNRQRLYYVRNLTSGAFAVNIKTAAGSAVEITQGAVADMYCDGSNGITFAGCETVPGTGGPATAAGAAASAVSVSPTGNLASTDAQAALVELQGDIDTINDTSLPAKQNLDSNLTTIAGLGVAKGNLQVADGSDWAVLAAGANGLGLLADSGEITGLKWAAVTVPADIGTTVQAWGAILDDLSGLTQATNKIPYFDSATTAATIDFLDEDDMLSNSATAVSSQQATKAYVDNEITNNVSEVFLASGSWGSVTSIDFNLDAYTAYDEIRFRLYRVDFSAAAQIYGRVFIDGGTTPVSAASSYRYSGMGHDSSDSAGNIGSLSTFWDFHSGNSNIGGFSVLDVIFVDWKTTAHKKTILFNGSIIDGGSDNMTVIGSVIFEDASNDITDWRLYPDSGDIGGSYAVYGRKLS
jgi:hypothetical protein